MDSLSVATMFWRVKEVSSMRAGPVLVGLGISS